jgi:hypothetical protein
MLLRCELFPKAGRCGGRGRVVVVPLESVSLNDGRLGEESVGLIDEGGVMELWEVVSIVEDDFADTSSTLCAGVFSV